MCPSNCPRPFQDTAKMLIRKVDRSAGEVTFYHSLAVFRNVSNVFSLFPEARCVGLFGVSGCFNPVQHVSY